MKFPDTLDGLRRILKQAIKLELTTNAGKINALGLFFVLVLVALGTVTDWIEDVIRMFRPKAVAPPTDFLKIVLIFAILFLICMGIVVGDDYLRHGGGGGRRHSRQ